MASALAEWNEKQICVITCDGRLIHGALAGYDQLQNLILKNATERVYNIPQHTMEDDTTSNLPLVEIVPLGLYVIRGDNVVLISDVDGETLNMEENIKIGVDVIDGGWDKAEPIKHVSQFIG